MATYTAYELTFKTGLHLGRYTGPAQTGQLGLEKTEVYIPADTLFSALCQTWATFYDDASLKIFLDHYTADETYLPFRLTSAFPFAGDVRFFPKPLLNLNVDLDPAHYKQLKKVQFVSQNVFGTILSDESPGFREDLLINGGKMWVDAEEKEHLKQLLNGETDDDDLTVWQTSRRPRVTLDRESHESQIWHVETLQFNQNCGLWFAAQFGANDSANTKAKVDALLNALGDAGIGGERNAGYGMFSVQQGSVDMETADGSDQFVTLAPICPNSKDELEALISGDGISYNLTTCGGWGNSTGTPFRRQTVMMFGEGSVLKTIEGESGRLVPLTPLSSDACEHSVYRYGYAWPVGIKGGQT